MDLLKIIELNKTYGKGDISVKALTHINLTVKRGEMVSIMGTSGCGKSTLLNMISGIDRPDSGKVFISNNDITDLEDNKMALFRRRQIGIVYQDFNLLPDLSVENNIKLPMLMDNKLVDEKFFNELVFRLGLENKLKFFPEELSGGQKQRVAIARSLIYRPELILADEPTGNLDSQNAMEIMDIFRQSNIKYKQTIIIVTHDEKIALSSDRIFHMKDGMIKEYDK